MKQRSLQLAALVVLSALPAFCAAAPPQFAPAAYELCIEHSPIKAGTVNPKVGTHRYSADSVVTLSANPQPGYQFAYWIGDVSDPKSNQTTVRLDAAKIVVAVFRSVQQDGMERKVSLGGGGGGPAKLLPARIDLNDPGFSVSGGGGGTRPVPVPVPVPVVPTPEPTTIVLFALGGLALRHTRRRT